MSQPDPNRLQSLIEQAGRLPLGEREAYVRSECGDDESMIQEVMTRLRNVEGKMSAEGSRQGHVSARCESVPVHGV